LQAIPREWLLGWYFYFDKYDMPGDFFERLIGQSVQHDGHNNDISRVLYWSRGAIMYRNKVQVCVSLKLIIRSNFSGSISKLSSMEDTIEYCLGQLQRKIWIPSSAYHMPSLVRLFSPGDS
jgi:hypothetical protein